MISDDSILVLIKEASVVVQLVMLLLAIVSIASWMLIFRKQKELKQAWSIADSFEEQFWSGEDLADLYMQHAAEDYDREGLENIFFAGYKEYARLHQQAGIPVESLLEGTQRAMRIAIAREADELDDHLPFLATVGSTSPYVGLFGTVWGIMNSFRALGNVQQATLALVAPGIAEALIATALGLFAAIPAVVAYNRYATKIERICTRYEIFAEEFVALLQRQSFTIREKHTRENLLQKGLS